MTITRDEVTTVADTRAQLSKMLRAFRQSSASQPVVLGSHRKPEAVLLPFARYENLTSSTPPSESALARLTSCSALIHRLADLNNVGSISVFGSVSRGTETTESDVDLLVEPRPSTSLFDLAQLEIDLEQLLGRRVDIISRNALDPQRDAAILAEAIPMKDEERTDRWIDDLESNLATARELASRGRSAFERDPALQLAFEALSNRVGDLAKKLTAADPTRFSDPVWSQAAKNRDFVVRHYGRVDLNILWQTVAIDFSKLVTPKATVAKRDLGPGAVDIATSPITTASQRARRRG